ncbi:MAG: hypothetical protein I8H66_03250 [Sphingobacteriia bacterium]|nr:hypothetical protein [Sphingobacteriia bacterium]
MKKGIAILMLAFLLFNWGGYRLLSDWLEIRSEENLQAELDQDIFDEAALLHIKVPVSLPYTNSSPVYEKVTGQIEIKGVSYTFVKRRFYMDSMELLCIPNAEKAGIRNARDQFFRLANDFVENSSSKKNSSSHPHTAKFSVQDFTEDHFFSWQFSCGTADKIQRAIVRSCLGGDYTKLQDHPPQV